MDRLTVVDALDELVLREDGLAFQRLARRLLKSEFPDLVAHAEKRDLGRDASFTRGSQRGILLASLTASWTKLKEDLARARSAGAEFELAIFATPRTVSNERIAQWAERVRVEGIELEVRERAWVTDECMRPRNAIIVIAELRITPAQTQGGTETVLAGEAFVVSEKPVSVGRTSVAMHGGRALLTWSEAPQLRDSERVVLAVCEGEEVSRTVLADGADGHCAVLGGEGYVCWTRRTEQGSLHTLSVWRESSGRMVDVAEVEELIAPPHLISWQGEPALVYLTGDRQASLAISVTTIDAAASSRLEIGPEALQDTAALDEDWAAALTPRVRGLSVAHEGGRAIALVHGDYSAQLFALTDHWRAIEAAWPFGGEIRAAEVALLDARAHCLAQVHGRGIYSGIADLGGRGWSSPTLIAASGWHPSCARAPRGWLGAWAGAPPLPVGAQSEAFAAGGGEQWLAATREAGEESLARAMFHRGEPDPQLAALTEIPLASPLAPLWVGTFDREGRCLNGSENLGFYGRAARWPQLALDGEGRGLLLWESGEEDEVWLLARWLQV